MHNSVETYIVDAFTDKAFKGNPAGVCLPLHDLHPEKMLAIAKELGLSETAFIRKLQSVDKYSIRYFSPKMEIPLCGHATLASSKVLFEKFPEIQKINFVNIDGLNLYIEKKQDLIQMEFPVYDTEAAQAPIELLNALGLSEVSNARFNNETKILMLEIADPELLQSLKPNFKDLIDSHNEINGVLVTAISNKEDYDFESRYFWPWSGTDEDPATGGTHTFLVKYWSERLGKTRMNSFQCSERTGFMEVELINHEKFTIKSKAVIVFKGHLNA